MRTLVIVAALCIASPTVATAGPYGAAGPNLVQNPGFEEAAGGVPVGWQAWVEGVYSSDETTASEGRRSLKFASSDPGRYVLCTQPIKLTPGLLYEVKARVKTLGIEGEDSGATVCLEWSDAEGKYLGGCYPSGVKGDNPEWVEVGGVSTTVPANAARATVSCYVRQGMTGTAWWDEVSVRRWRQPAMYSFLVSPSYRGWVLDDNLREARVRVRLVDSELEGGRSAVRIAARLTRAEGGEPLAERVVDAGAEDPFDVRVPLPKLAPGAYVLRVALVSKENGEVIHEEAHRIERRAGPPPKSYVDEHNRLIIDGEPFLPLGMYWGDVREEELRVYAEGPFNCLMPYGRPDREQMDLIGRMGLKAFYSIKDYYHGTEWCPDFIKSEADEEGAVRAAVREFRDHPALLAWYINDERPLSMLPRLQAHQRWVEEEDPDHPTWVVLYQVEDIDRYAGSFDIIGSDPYPIPDRPAAMAGQWARLTREGVAGAKAVWMVPQVFRWPDKARAPSFDELRSMTWQCITEGATGIIFYSWFEIRADKLFPFSQRWEEVKRVAVEVKEMAPVLLSAEPAPAVEVEAPESVHWLVRKREGAVHLFLVNDSAQEARVSARFPWRPRRAAVGGREVELDRDGRVSLALPPLGVSICRIEE